MKVLLVKISDRHAVWRDHFLAIYLALEVLPLLSIRPRFGNVLFRFFNPVGRTSILSFFAMTNLYVKVLFLLLCDCPYGGAKEFTFSSF